MPDYPMIRSSCSACFMILAWEWIVPVCLMRGKDGSIIQGRNNDTGGFGGEELAKLTVVVRHNAIGKNAVTHMDQLLYMGVETGYNSKGLSFGERNTPYIKNQTQTVFPSHI